MNLPWKKKVLVVLVHLQKKKKFSTSISAGTLHLGEHLWRLSVSEMFNIKWNEFNQQNDLMYSTPCEGWTFWLYHYILSRRRTECSIVIAHLTTKQGKQKTAMLMPEQTKVVLQKVATSVNDHNCKSNIMGQNSVGIVLGEWTYPRC